jgi:tRNA-Thr(GGU) m(6)t(6)A37 methyltransferase TsaA
MEVQAGDEGRRTGAVSKGRQDSAESSELAGVPSVILDVVTSSLEDSLGHQHYELQPIGWVESPIVDRAAAPKQGDEGAPDAWLAFDARFSEGLRDLQVGDQVILLTWLDRAHRDVLVVHPRGDPANPLQGVFNTRSPDRPNPIGLHRVEILAIEGTRIRVRNLEALDGTPIVDVKPVLDRRFER